MQAPKEETKKGVRNIATTMMLYMVASGVLFAMALLLFAVLIPAATASGPANFGSILATLVIIGLFVIIYAILIIAVIILGLMGWFRIRGGMDEFGPTHRASVETGTLYIVLGIVTTAIGVVSGIYWSLSGAGSVAIGLVIGPAVSVLSATLFGMGVMRLVEQLADAEERKNLWNFFYLTLAGTIVATAITFVWVVVQSASLQQGNLSGFSSLGFAGAGSIVVLIGYIFGWMAYSSIARKMEGGSLRPGMPLPTGGATVSGATASSGVPPPMPPVPGSRP